MSTFPWAIQVGAVSERGAGRRENADRAGYVIPPPSLAARGGVFVVADGVGEGRGAVLAARAAVERFLRLYYERTRRPGPQALLHTLQRVQRLVREGAQGTTTFTALLVGAQYGWVVHVGDTRAYLVRNRRIYRLTRDDVLLEGQRGHPTRFANVLTQAVGMSRRLRPQIAAVRLQPNDTFVLSSDGVHDYVSPSHMGWFALTYPPLQAAALMARWALSAGSRDDRTVVVVRVLSRYQPSRVRVPAPGLMVHATSA